MIVTSILCLPVFSTRAATKLQSRTWVWNKYFALLDTSTLRYHCQLWAGLQRWGAWRGGKTIVLLTLGIIPYVGSLLYFCVFTHILGQIAIEDLDGKDLLLKRGTWPPPSPIQNNSNKNSRVVIWRLWGKTKQNNSCSYWNVLLTELQVP